MDDLLDKVISAILSQNNLAVDILLGIAIFLAWLLNKERKAREEADKLDREFAKDLTKALTDLTVSQAEIKGVILTVVGRK